jgi:hypothetical protein
LAESSTFTPKKKKKKRELANLSMERYNYRISIEIKTTYGIDAPEIQLIREGKGSKDISHPRISPLRILHT